MHQIFSLKTMRTTLISTGIALLVWCSWLFTTSSRDSQGLVFAQDSYDDLTIGRYSSPNYAQVNSYWIEFYAEVEPQKLIGGLICYIDWGWLDIDTIWIDAGYRKKGIGQYLVTSAEQKAKNKGIKRAKLCTFDFQALSFYEKLGYTVYGKLEDFPEGHRLYYLKKILPN